MKISRRRFLSVSGTAATALLLESCLRSLSATNPSSHSFGPLQRDPDGMLDLPEGFQYRILSQVGARMDDGHRVPDAFDGMGAFAAPDGSVILVRNHELLPDARLGVAAPATEAGVPLYDPRCRGGTTTLVVSPDQAVLKQFATLGGTSRNCAGGATPWGSWVSCEEITDMPGSSLVTKPHGYNFEVPITATGLVEPEPLVAMGRFRHEAIAVDPRTGWVYQTEDQVDGLFYRFIPTEPGNLKAGGRLEALMLGDRPQANTSRGFAVGQQMPVQWVPIEQVDPPEDTVRHEGFRAGAAQFSRGEGICYSDGHLYFTCTNGGDVPHGQVWKYTPNLDDPNGGLLELIVQPNDPRQLDYPDNLIMAPWGDLLLCEDGGGEQFVVGVTPSGEVYPFARNAFNRSEFAGICVSPDGNTLFLNIYSPGVTFAIWRV